MPAGTPDELDATALLPAGDPSKEFPPEPQNFGEPPTFGHLTLLFRALLEERRQDRRREILEKWFSKTTAGDFPGLAYEVLNKRSSITGGGSLRIDQLNELLDELSRKGSKLEHQKRIFAQLYLKCSAAELRWIIRIILKDLNVGAKETTVLSVFHPDALAVFNSSSDLKRVSYELWDSSYRVNDVDKTVRMFRSFAPMLSKRPPKNLADAVKRFGGVTFKVEEKLDGERIQLHKRGDTYFYCSRKSKDYTYLYGKSPTEGSLTPFLHASFNPDVHECILDGEMLVWDPISERYLPFGTLKSHAGEKAPTREYSPRPCFKVFDLVFLNGKSLTHESLAFRRRNLQNVFDPVPGRLELVHQHDASTLGDVQKLLRDTVEERGEGLILKHPLSTYLLNGRNDYWIKIKPEYMDGDGETFDLLVVGGNYGTGSRGGGVSTLICAVRDDRPNAAGAGEQKWSSFCRIGSGLSFADFVMIRAKPWIEWGSKGPSFLQTAPRSRDDKGDVYLNPEDSFILTVKAAEITETDQYSMRMTLRFPRAISIREEFRAEDAATVSEIFEHIASGKKRKREAEASASNKKRNTGRKKAIVAGAFQSTSGGSKLPVESQLFSGKTFVVYSTTKAAVPYSKPDLEKVIRANGGAIRTVRSQDGDNILIYGGENAPGDIKKIMKEDRCDLVYPQWVLDCVRKQEIIPLREKYLRFKSAGHDPDTEDEDEEEEDEEPLNNIKTKEPGSSTRQEEDDSMEERESNGENMREPLEAHPHADWIKVEPDDSIEIIEPPLSDEELTEHEDLDDDHDEGTGGGESWIGLFKTSRENPPKSPSNMEDVRMGDTDDAAEYDPDLIFKHLLFYLDSPSNARKNGLNVSTQNEGAIEARFSATTKLILTHGGKVTTDLSEPKLTHVVMDSEHLSRRKELMRLTEKPRRRRFVIREYIEYCLEPDVRTLADERGR
ncbi:hypothetical protein M408DRAFT_325903 [Serendipita vermifera MAFF 305830]|uniref:DNA ligase n=1 Tax=Serendipita vermifera MAFF 305830 TaxID=933852 RepID=A0A0C3BT29_SERVB|nr:hypothetical protein M408DRAFT_325903 [Serendipita vermifera MAFF 305830]